MDQDIEIINTETRKLIPFLNSGSNSDVLVIIGAIPNTPNSITHNGDISNNHFHSIMDFSSILIINYFLNPLLAFTIYFCFLHSIRHSLTLVFELE